MLTKRLALTAFAAVVALSGSLAAVQPAAARPHDRDDRIAQQRFDRDDARRHHDRDDRHMNRNGNWNNGNWNNGNWNGNGWYGNNGWNGNNWNGNNGRRHHHRHDRDHDGD